MSLDKAPWGPSWVRRPDAVLEFLAGQSVHLGPLVGARGFGTTCLRRTWTLQAWTQVDTMRVWLSEELLPVDEGTGVFCIMCVIFFMCESLEGMCTVCLWRDGAPPTATRHMVQLPALACSRLPPRQGPGTHPQSSWAVHPIPAL